MKDVLLSTPCFLVFVFLLSCSGGEVDERTASNERLSQDLETDGDASSDGTIAHKQPKPKPKPKPKPTPPPQIVSKSEDSSLKKPAEGVPCNCTDGAIPSGEHCVIPYVTGAMSVAAMNTACTDLKLLQNNCTETFSFDFDESFVPSSFDNAQLASKQQDFNDLTAAGLTSNLTYYGSFGFGVDPTHYAGIAFFTGSNFIRPVIYCRMENLTP